MVDPRASVVEVTEIVPPDEVPFVAARVAERLNMPVERVRKLIDARTGPITRPLRPDKADAIAQTFEAAGVVVVIRPATEEDEVALLASASGAARSRETEQPSPQAPLSPPDAADPAVAADSSAAKPATDVEDEVGVEPAADVEADAEVETAADVEADVEAESEPRYVPATSDPVDRPLAGDGAAAPPDVSEAVGTVPVGEAADVPPRVEADASESPGATETPSAATALGEPAEVVVRRDLASDGRSLEVQSESVAADVERDEIEHADADAEAGVADAVRDEEADIAAFDVDAAADVDAFDIEAEAGADAFDVDAAADVDAFDVDAYDVSDLDTDADDLAELDTDPFDVAEFETDASDQDGVGLDARRHEHEPGPVPDEAGEGVVIELPDDRSGMDAGTSEPSALTPAAFPSVRSERPAGSGVQLDPDSDGDDTNEPGPYGWAARGEVIVRRVSAATFADDGAGASVEADDDRQGAAPVEPPGEDAGARLETADRGVTPFGDPSSWHSEDDPAGGWTITSRTARRLAVVTDDDAVADLADEPHAPGAESTASALGRSPAREAEDVAPTDVPADTDGVSTDVGDERAGAPDADPPVPLRVTPGDGRAAESARAEPSADEPPVVGRASRRPRYDGDDDAPHEAGPPAAVGARVPTAWRGLGGAERGPARPVDARLPRRGEHANPGRSPQSEAARVTRRRTVMLVTLAVALGLFVLAQAWVAGRAAPAFDAGLHRFRDADFAAARRVWTGLASAGDANAQFMLGYLSEAGLGRPWSARAAAAWYRLAADAGHAEAQWRLANLYEQGLGVAPDVVAAERWWTMAAAGGHAEAAFTLGRSLLEGGSGVPDGDAALAAFERAAALGWPAAVPYRDTLRLVSERAHADAIP